MVHRWLRLHGREAGFRAVSLPDITKERGRQSRSWKRGETRKALGFGGRRLTFAFTLMELMIALGLLGALMAVAWSLMGTFGNAEIRGWKLAHRVQTIRSARDWLESDMQHLALSVGQTGLNMPNLSEGPQFTGDSLGFTATIAPSVDPIPFLENLMSDAMRPEPKHSATERSPRMPSPSMPLAKPKMGYSATRDDAAPSTIWPAETVVIEYRLSPAAASSVRSLAELTGNSDETQFVLNRRELVDSHTITTVGSPSERVLSTQDLYGQSDDATMSNRHPFRESRLEKLTKVRFHYFDGVSWLPQWDSVQQGGLPRAISFGFDFPKVSDMKPPSNASVKRSEQGSSMIDNGMETDLSLADSAMATGTSQLTSQSNPGMMESSSNEVQIVVYVGRSASESKDTAIQSRQRDIP